LVDQGWNASLLGAKLGMPSAHFSSPHRPAHLAGRVPESIRYRLGA
jgi:hypothetical protein